ncbi:MAG TPA: bifunctional diaminohydroxyphosphoribosylaminopyrimidine deaminase/5-amino-6-(5-phosphoribosylamino)uracil reductase RibD [Candidatus Nanopelagicaceae bacterium]|nr:bifunctional diaminohydroxyphosphoribosylaminopyrimidine deaminase/5-amino-6-(5-phosphoribosylamino)uracil reductase RibD [Candidatus Nanopelagicaceae bacterium]
MASESVDLWMSRALDLARTGLGRTGSNPIVGAVLVKDGVVVGEGFHEALGGPHAEINALRQAGDAARGSTLYVTLEPCAHFGRTEPCVDAIIKAEITEVVISALDPNPIAAGGLARLKTAGIQVVVGPLQERALWENRAWRHWIANGRPYVIWKVAASIDGRIAAADGTSQWISGEKSRQDAQFIRGASHAIVTGTGTALRDNPELSVRDGSGRTPLRVVVGERDIPADAKVFSGSQETLLIKDRSPQLIVDQLNFRHIVQAMLECGPRMAANWLEEGLIDELVVYTAPILLGGGPALFSDLKVASINDRRQLHIHDVLQIGSDLRTTYTTKSWEV